MSKQAWTNAETIAFIEQLRSQVHDGLAVDERLLMLEEIDGACAYLRFLEEAQEVAKQVRRTHVWPAVEEK
jgi:hypothetical protein